MTNNIVALMRVTLCLVLSFFLTSANAQNHMVSHLEEVLDLNMNHLPGNKLHLDFTVFGKSYAFDMGFMGHLHAHNQTVETKSYSVALPEDGGWATATILNDGTLHAVVAVAGEKALQIDPARFHNETVRLMFHGHIAHRLEDKMSTGHGCGLDALGMNPNIKFVDSPSAKRKLQSQPLPKMWSNCYANDHIPHRLDIGLVVDYSYYEFYSKSVSQVMESISMLLAATNMIYQYQLNIKISAKNVVILKVKNQYSNKPMLDVNTCPGSVSAHKDKFEEWLRAHEPEDLGLWHLLTSCVPCQSNGQSFQVGIASKPGLCLGKSSNTGVSDTTCFSGWTTFAHEIGHNFGASHSFRSDSSGNILEHYGGIMDYGSENKFVDGIIQFNTARRKQEVCSTIDDVVSVCKHLEQYSPTCGNREVELGEECECPSGGTECDCCKNCKWKTGAVCHSSQDCCNSQCKYEHGTCGPEGNMVCDMGACRTENICSRYGGEFCALFDDTKCKVKCKFDGVCSTRQGWTINNQPFQNFLNLEEGTGCSTNDGKLGKCDGEGVCITLVPTPKPTMGTCGDGKLQFGEECECPKKGSKNCNCCKNCMLKAGAECFPWDNDNSDCCNGSTCKYTSGSCGEKKGWCAAGVCRKASRCHIFTNFESCESFSNPCRFGCHSIGASWCNTDNTDFTFNGNSLPEFIKPDGVNCGTGMVCNNGQCVGVSPTKKPTKDPTRKPTKAPPTKKPTKTPTEKTAVPVVNCKKFGKDKKKCLKNKKTCVFNTKQKKCLDKPEPTPKPTKPPVAPTVFSCSALKNKKACKQFKNLCEFKAKKCRGKGEKQPTKQPTNQPENNDNQNTNVCKGLKKKDCKRKKAKCVFKKNKCLQK